MGITLPDFIKPLDRAIISIRKNGAKMEILGEVIIVERTKTDGVCCCFSILSDVYDFTSLTDFVLREWEPYHLSIEVDYVKDITNYMNKPYVWSDSYQTEILEFEPM